MLLPSAEPLVKDAAVRRLQLNDTVLTVSLERETAQEWFRVKAMVMRETKIRRKVWNRKKKNQPCFGQQERGGGRRKGMEERGERVWERENE